MKHKTYFYKSHRIYHNYHKAFRFEKNILKVIAIRYFSIIATLLIVVSIYSYRNIFSAPISIFTSSTAKSAVFCMFPDSAKSYSAPTEKAKTLSNIPITSEVTQTTKSSKEKSADTTEKAVIASANSDGKIKIQTIGYSGANLAVNNLHIANNTGLTVNLTEQLNIVPDIAIYKNSGNKRPQVLILHTHATECYYEKESATYSDSWAVKSRDNTKNVVSVGNVIAATLEKAGISVLHDTTQYDRDAYSGSYARARVTTENYLEKYPSIDVVLDIHRDSITYDDSTKLRPITEVNGKKAAQIMICCGSESGSVEDYPNWQKNFRFAIRLQQACEKKYKNLARPMYFVSKKYNHDLCNGSALIEVGSEANTLAEAQYSGVLIANALIDVFRPLTEE